MKATGMCFTCNKSVPDEMLNKFYCSHSCREIAYGKYIDRKFEEFKAANPSLEEDELQYQFDHYIRRNF